MTDIEAGGLVLQRKKGETICIGDDIFITITECSNYAVKLLIKAPRETGIYRKEIYDRIQNEKTDTEG